MFGLVAEVSANIPTTPAEFGLLGGLLVIVLGGHWKLTLMHRDERAEASRQFREERDESRLRHREERADTLVMFREVREADIASTDKLRTALDDLSKSIRERG